MKWKAENQCLQSDKLLTRDVNKKDVIKGAV